MSIGVKISLPGQRVETSSPEQSSFNSDYPSPMIKLEQQPSHFGVFTYTFTSTPAVGETMLKTIKHGYKYIPLNFVIIKYNDGATGRTMPLPAQYTASLSIYAYCDSSNLSVVINRSPDGADPTGQTWIFKYYIFADEGG